MHGMKYMKKPLEGYSRAGKAGSTAAHPVRAGSAFRAEPSDSTASPPVTGPKAA